ncbi:NADPH:quinone reductase [Amycolatopsis deserti]|uniref:NADPH:quinone reductase n=1 Tax=Amycolatopsis deserti TaxID=185696 RepID=A0ABQ3JHZ1_9PSEU|nr:zinc-binding dehydrogenase [Amycolatopsis deserti]GHF26506.1 NADPH:quinone reductase [Amycolatopsis deserti]
MRAAVADGPGGPEVLRVREIPTPEARDGWALVRVEGFGLNRSELMTRQGHSPNVRFPRVLGIECVGVVVESARLAPGTKVAAVMGEMGREFDGGYAEYALLPEDLLIPVETDLPWDVFAALPETYLTAWGSLATFGPTSPGQSLLIRGGTSSVGMAMLSLARERGLVTIATTRNREKVAALEKAGASHVVVDGGDIAADVRALRPEGPDYVLDLIGAPTVADSLQLAARGGTVCVTGMLSGKWSIPDFQPTAVIPSGTKLTAFQSNDIQGSSGAGALQTIVDGVARGAYQPNLDRVFRLDEIVEAHAYMEDNHATGKVVVRNA